jgi:GTP diphosphokinase / guanosine-3',5'-bis(diphosphate) 3'-diphosphatase
LVAYFNACAYTFSQEQNEMQQFEAILKKASTFNPYINRERLTKAYTYAKRYNEGRYRLSGDPAIVHYLSVTDILLSLRTDEDTVIAGMLHGISDMPEFNEDEFRRDFGDRVFYLISAVASLKNVKSRSAKVEAESLRRMFVAMAKDLRVILIKLADRLNNMETISFFPVSKQKQIAKETLDIYVPISARLGIYLIKSRLEDLAFQYLYPKQYEQLSKELGEYLLEREQTIDDIKKEVKKYLLDHNIQAEVDGRIKNLYSIYRKLKVKNHSTLRDIFDVFAVRVILPDKHDANGEENTDHLYAVLGLIHRKWHPVAHRFKDYVALPKPNGYASLHTAVLGMSSKDSQVTEIQIRSRRMHEEAEFGVATHWIYDANKKVLNKRTWEEYSVESLVGENETKKYVDWIQALAKLQTEFENGGDLIDALKIDVFTDRIFVMTPHGDVKDLPLGSTVIDFAYSVNTDIGHKCVSAKVNGNVVPLDYQIKNGEVIEIIEGPYDDPKANWLSFVKTSLAKRKIQTYFKSLDKEKIFEEGKYLINRYLKEGNKPLLDEELTIFKKFNGKRLSMKDRCKLVEDVGSGIQSALRLLQEVFGQSFGENRKARALRPSTMTTNKKLLPNNVDKPADDQIFIAGETGMPYKFANCCKPKPGVPIVGYINRNHEVNIHLQRCPVLRNAMEDRVLEAFWGSDMQSQKYHVKLELLSKNRVGLIRDIAEVITKMNLNILFFSDMAKEGDSVRRDIVIEVADNNQLNDVMNKLQRIRNVEDVRRAD